MKKFTEIIEKKKQQIQDAELVNEANLYLEFSKKYNKKHGVSGPFDKKFKGKKEEQKKYMSGLSKAWKDEKEKKGMKSKTKKDFIKESINESKALDMAKQMIGDGGDPNYHFVTMSDDYYFEKNEEMTQYSKDQESAPLKIKTTPDFGVYTFGPFMNLEESKLFAESIELDEINGPRLVKIEDRQTGEVFTKYLTCKMQPVWDENATLPAEQAAPEEEEYEDPNSEYTYGDEEEE